MIWNAQNIRGAITAAAIIALPFLAISGLGFIVYSDLSKCQYPLFITATTTTGEKAVIKSSAVTLVFEASPGDKVGEVQSATVLWTGTVNTHLKDDIDDIKQQLCIGE